MLIGSRWRLGCTLIFLFLLSSPPAPILDGYPSTHTPDLSFSPLFSTPFLLVSGGVTRCVIERTVTFHLHYLRPASRLPYSLLLSFGHPPSPLLLRGPPIIYVSSGRAALLARLTRRPRFLPSLPIDSLCSFMAPGDDGHDPS